MSDSNSKPLIVAQIMGKWVGGGVETVIMNYYRHIDKTKIQFDFICDEDSTNIPYDEIKKLGGNVILCPPYQNIIKYERFLIELFKRKKYKIVHSNINALSVFPLRAAKKADIPIRIAHSHSTSNKKEWKKNLLKSILKKFSRIYATDYFACTEHAGRWLFGNKAFNNGNIMIINNAIDLEKYKYDFNIRKRIRNSLNITDSTVVFGHIGRFVKQKNHEFLIDLFDKIYHKNSDSILMLIGQGPLENEIKAKVEKMQLQNNVLFLGQRENVYDYYNAMDCFLLPSLYEGLGMVLIEAQANLLPCFVSDKVPQEAKVSDNIYFLSLEESKEYWLKIVMKKSYRSDNTLINDKINMYDIDKEVNKLAKWYLTRI